MSVHRAFIKMALQPIYMCFEVAGLPGMGMGLLLPIHLVIT